MNRSKRTESDRLARLDRAFVAYLQHHIDLLLAISALGLILWAIAEHHDAYVPAICVVGAVSFFIGFIPSLGVALIWTAWLMTRMIASAHAVDMSVEMMEAFGYGCVGWLGFRHREAQRIEMERLENRTIPAGSVIPWAVANEIRSSLAAVRFMLFPLQTHADLTNEEQSLERATEELSRLETLFRELSPERPGNSHFS